MKKLFKAILYFLIIALGIVLIAVIIFNIYYSALNNQAKKELAELNILTIDEQHFRDLNKNGELDTYEDHRQPTAERVNDLLSQMTIEEKVGLMWHPPIAPDDDGKLQAKPGLLSPVSTYDVIINKKINHFNLFRIPGTKVMAQWSNRLQKLAEQTRLGIPVSISTEPLHGISNFIGIDLLEGGWSKWPEPIGLAATRDSSLVAEFAQIANQEYRAVGIRVALHPIANLTIAPHRVRINETFGEDAQLSAQMTAAYIYGFQGDSLHAKSVACMTKYWPGGDLQENNKNAHFHYGRNQIYTGNNFNEQLIPFEVALKTNTAMIMPYYGIALGQANGNADMSFNKEIITKLLRGKYNYDGVVCTDWGVIDGFSFLGYEIVEAKDWGVEDPKIEERIAEVLESGVDQFGGSMHTKQLLKLIKKGEITEDRIDESARRLLKVKFELGLFDNPFVDPEQAEKIVNNDRFNATGKVAQRKSIVLLKNQENSGTPLLPIPKEYKIYIENIDPEVASQYALVVDSLNQADVAILRLQTLYEKQTGDFIESFFHQKYVDIQEPELSRILAITNQKPTIICLYINHPPGIMEITSHCEALLADFGAQDDAVLDIVFGEFNPTAKLPFEIQSSMEAVVMKTENAPDDSKTPLFPFGYGLSYE